ncbi:hypothetical protein EK21DRAFT_93130 [Setomelanomma holmii]|uniref:Uncharacterized protein n=1 Tax=Setomelanomma holmii TaxID=210430 RepID=A0A9P4LHK8_9PLEO|nr:hypothetical protein EK21DRAFT_93130 [Setomelanomma holmii]
MSDPEFRPQPSIHGYAARIIFLTPILAMAGLAILCTWYSTEVDFTTGTGLFSRMLWLTFSLGSAVFFVFNIARARDRTTVVPGVSTLWYRLYSTVLFLLALALLITASLETKETWCGKFTILDESVCPDIRHIPLNTSIYFDATAIDRSRSGRGRIHATEAYLPGNFHMTFWNAFLDATSETAYPFLTRVDLY